LSTPAPDRVEHLPKELVTELRMMTTMTATAGTTPTYCIYMVTDQRLGEPDLLVGNTDSTLIIKDLNGSTLLEVQAPDGGWSHPRLQAWAGDNPIFEGDAFLGDLWIGGTEV